LFAFSDAFDAARLIGTFLCAAISQHRGAARAALGGTGIAKIKEKRGSGAGL
jgi:hypothetical protein